jgi:WD40 repeat protein
VLLIGSGKRMVDALRADRLRKFTHEAAVSELVAIDAKTVCTNTGRYIQLLTLSEARCSFPHVMALAVSRTRLAMITVGGSRKVMVVDLSHEFPAGEVALTAREVEWSKTHRRGVQAAAMHPWNALPTCLTWVDNAFDGTALIIGSSTGPLVNSTLADRDMLPNGRCMACRTDEKNSHRGWVSCVAYGLGVVASGSGDGTVKLWSWRVGFGDCSHTLTGHRGDVRALCFCGELLASAGDDATIRLWSIAGKDLVGVLRSEGKIRALSCCGALLASAGNEIAGEAGPFKAVRVWDVQRRALLSRIVTLHKGNIASLILMHAAHGTRRPARTANAASLPMPPSGLIEASVDRASPPQMAARRTATCWRRAAPTKL